MSEATDPRVAPAGETMPTPDVSAAPRPKHPRGPRYSKEEFRRRGDEVYERDVLPTVGPQDKGKFVAIDIETGEFEIDADDLAVTDRLYARLPDAQPWLRKIGYSYTYRLGFPKDSL